MMIIRAPYIVTKEGVLQNHAVVVEEERIQKIVPRKECGSSGNVTDLPETILFPGLVNCHTHLELSGLPEPLPYPGTFTGWIEALARLKFQMGPKDTEEAIQQGIKELLAGGTTTVADHLSATLSPELILNSPLEGLIYIEVLGVEETRARKFYEEAKENAKKYGSDKKFRFVVTPHATYSLLPSVFADIIAHHEGEPHPLSIHVAESYDEHLLFKENTGPLYKFLEQMGEAPSAVGETAVGYLERFDLLQENSMYIHGNYLNDEDIKTLQEYNVSVVHCPGSHTYFEHERFPLGLLLDSGVNVAFGTDSRASNASLSMFEQMRRMLDVYAELTPESVFKMATANGAKALQREKEIGSLAPGKLANMVGVSYRFPKRDVFENILLAEKANFSMVRGKGF